MQSLDQGSCQLPGDESGPATCDSFDGCQPESSLQGELAGRRKNRRVLVIDDNPAIHDDLRNILAADGAGGGLTEPEAAYAAENSDIEARLDFELETAREGTEGLAKVVAAVADNRPYAVVFVDTRMPPGGDGLTTIEQLWKADPDLQVVICTAHSGNSWFDICRRLGQTDRLLVLKKPLDNVEVCQLALALTEKWNLTQQARSRQAELQQMIDERNAQLHIRETALRQKQKLEAVGSLAAGVAHEFNNLLQVIRGYSQIAMEEIPPEEVVHQDLKHVVQAADRAAAITGQLLSFSRQQPGHKSNGPVNDIVTMTLKMLQPALGKQIELDITLDEDAGLVRADANIMSQVLVNLCINARDAMPSGGKLQVTTERTVITDRRGNTDSQQPDLPPGDYSAIKVADTGCGIPDDVRDRIFDPFFTTKDAGKGSGMGLAMVFGAVQDHDGIVTVESIENKGATFKIFLPIVSPVAEDVPRSVGQNEASPPAETETLLTADH